MKTLIISYACEPDKTSEPGVGWNFSSQISKFAETTVLTRKNNKAVIQNQNFHNINFIYYDLNNFFLFFKKRIPLGTQIYFFFWQIGAYLKIKEILKTQKFDIIHHVNFSLSWNPPPFKLIDSPIVWGPVGRSDFIPFKFLIKMGLNAIVNETIYKFMYVLSNFFDLDKNKNLKAILYRTSKSSKADRIKEKKTFIISETASVDILKIKYQKKIIKSEFIHAICVGRLNYWKGFIFAVKGFHNFILNGGKGKLEIYGEGECSNNIKEYIRKNNLENFIFIKGFVKNNFIKEVMKKAHVLIHPSFRDGGSWSILEAMSFSMPVICLNTSGPKDMVTKNCGFLIDLDNEHQIMSDIGGSLLKLSNDKKLFDNLSRSAYNRIKSEYTWDKRRSQIKNVYDSVLNSNLDV
jgi:glycosyltransferase involved in cell wall biosynthesis